MTSLQDSPHAWFRLAAAVLLSTIGGVGMWSVVVVLPYVQVEFGIDRAAASIPYTVGMLGFGAGGILLGRVADRFGVIFPVVAGAICICLGYVAAGLSTSLWQFALAHFLLIGLLGTAASFGPLMADVSLWFVRRRGIAVAICASGNYLAGTVWPPVVEHFSTRYGWRPTYVGIGLFCVATMLPLALVALRRPPPVQAPPTALGRAGYLRPLGFSPGVLQGLLMVAGVSCCVAMSMPQVHIVAYCGDLGFGVARGTQMLSLMLGFGIVSRIATGAIADRIGGLATLLVGSALQALALLLFMMFDSLISLYVISALFGLFQGGIVPSYAIIVREYFPAGEAGTRVGVVLMATLVGMALGGWMSGLVFDATGSYRAAFGNGVAWNLLNIGIAGFLLTRGRGAARALAA